VPESVRQAIDATTVAMLRKRGSYKWTAAGPDGLGAAVAEMDFGAAPAILDALAALSADANFGYLSPVLADQLAEACAELQQRRYHWTVDPGLIHNVPDVIKGLELAITRFSRPGSPVILPTPAYMPFLTVPGFLGREIIQVRMIDDGGFFTFDLDAIEDAFRAGGHLLIFCNPYNPLGRVFTGEEIAAVTDVVDRHGGRVFADEIHAPLVYPGPRHIPYASTSDTAAAHTLTATSASKAWNLPGLKCAQVILSSERDQQRWEEMGFLAPRGASNPGVVANIAAYRHGEDWLDEVLGYLDDSRRLLADLLARHLPEVRYRPPDGTYLAWLDCTGLDLPDSPGALVTERAQVTVVDGPAFGDGGPGSFRLNFATPQPILAEMVDRIAAVLNASPAPPSPHPHHPLQLCLGRHSVVVATYPQESVGCYNH
jgi:cysteine-S-conjugate beta-lyase